MRTSIQVYESIRRNGWCPALWKHHPQEIKDAIKAMGFRPQVKECFRNCQKFVLMNEMLGLGLDVEYHEGWILATIPMEHAWLVYKGELLDLTLSADRDIQYLDSTGHDFEDVRDSCIRTGMFKPVDDYRMREISPFGTY